MISRHDRVRDIGIQFVQLAFESFGGLSDLVRKTLKRIALLADNRNFQPAGLSIAYNRLPQGVSLSLMRGSATRLIARDSLLWDSFLRQHPQPHNIYFTVLAHPILVAQLLLCANLFVTQWVGTMLISSVQPDCVGWWWRNFEEPIVRVSGNK